MFRYAFQYAAKARIVRGLCLRRELHNPANGWNAVIGLEIHAQIDSQTKLFSGMNNSVMKYACNF
jgi:GatB/GatE catalytic domain